MDEAVALRAAEQPRLSGRGLRILKDEKLAALAAGGNDDAFATLYRRHHQAIYRYSLSLLRQEADARDALQSTMLAALSSLRSRPIEGAFKPWLFRIAHNQSISIIRGRAREAPTDAPPPATFTDDPETREQLRTLVSDLAALPDRQRGAIVMRELSGLSYAEIAAALATSEAGGKQLVYEARTALHELRDGHEMSCDLVRERISAADLRLLRGRKVRAHLRTCQPCQDFEEAIRRRRTAFALFAPPLAPLAAAAVLQDVFGGGAGVGAGGAGGAGSAVGATGVVMGGAPLAGPAAFKLMAMALVAGAAGIGTYEAVSAIVADPVSATSTAPAARDAGAGQSGRHDAAGNSGHAPGAASGRGADGGTGAPGANPRADAGGTGSPGGSETSNAGEPAPSGTAGGPGEPAGPGDSGGAPGSGPGPAEPPTPPSPGPSPPPSPEPPAPPPSGGGSGVPPGTPPGHGGTPPGQGGTPPGQAGGGVPPGHLGNPGGGRP